MGVTLRLRCCCLGQARRAQLLKKSAWLLRLIGDKAQPAAHDSIEVICIKLTLLTPPQKWRAHLMLEEQYILVGKIFHPERSH